MKKFFSKLMKDTRGVVMMEYIILGLFAVAVTVAGVHVLGKTYNNGLLAMSYATLGATYATVQVVNQASAEINADRLNAQLYAEDLIQAADDGAVIEIYGTGGYDVYTP